jgi:prepilin-type N-terminal cleavage/methylation domain-containing protein
VLIAMRNHKGYTLIEVVVALVIMLAVTGSIFKLLRTNQRLSRAQAERVDLQSNVRTASIVIPSELRELSTFGAAATLDRNDVLVAGGTNVTYRAMRGIGFVCEAPAAGQVKILKSTWSGLRAPDAVRDDGYVFFDGNEDKNTDDVWLPVTITGVANSTCGGNAAWSLTILPTVGALVGIPVNTPVRLFEVMQLSLYTDAAGKSWLGAQTVSDLSPQPLLGPLRGADGLGFKYYSAPGTETALVGDIKSIRVTVRGLSSQLLAGHGGSSQTSVVQDSLTTEVLLRNSFRP